MGCCFGMSKTININKEKEIFISPEIIEKNEEKENIKNQVSNSQNILKTNKDEGKKEKSTVDFSKNQKNDKTENKKDINEEQNISPGNKENRTKVNKTKDVKKVNQRVQNAMRELKLLSMQELDNNTKFFA